MNITTKAQYTEHMTAIENGEKLDPKTFDSLRAFAKSKKIKQPPAEARLDKAPKKATGRPVKEPVECSEKDCAKQAKVKGLCVMHDARVRRQDPAVREATREASRKYHRKLAAKKAEAQEQATAIAS